MSKLTEMIVDQNPDTLFVFGDNVVQKGFGGQAKVCRGKRNCIGIPTKHRPRRNSIDYFCDSQLIMNKLYIENAYVTIVSKLKSYDRLVILPEIGTGLAELDKRAPLTFGFLTGVLDTLRREEKYVKYTQI